MLDDAKETIHPTAVAVANHQKFRVLLNTGAGGRFLSSTLINHIILGAEAFLQIGIDKEDHNALRLHWVKDLKTIEIITLRFTRQPFGCASSPFIVTATLTELLQACIKKKKNKAVAEEIQYDLFVDDLRYYASFNF